MTKKATVKAVIMFFIVHLPSLPCRPCVEENEIPSEAYNVIDSKKDSEAYWCLMTLTGLCTGN